MGGKKPEEKKVQQPLNFSANTRTFTNTNVVNNNTKLQMSKQDEMLKKAE